MSTHKCENESCSSTLNGPAVTATAGAAAAAGAAAGGGALDAEALRGAGLLAVDGDADEEALRGAAFAVLGLVLVLAAAGFAGAVLGLARGLGFGSS